MDDRSAIVRFATEQGIRARLAVRGTSMLPLLHEPYVLELGPCTRLPRRGDIVVYPVRDRLIAHRVVDRAEDAVLCAGDATPDTIERVAFDAIVGVVRAVRSSADAAAPRVDGPAFRIRGLLYARTRALRARRKRLDPLQRDLGFAALFSMVSAIVCKDRASLEVSLERASAEAVADAAHRHRCEALLANALNSMPQTDAIRQLQARVQRDAWATALRTKRLREQLVEVLSILRENGVDPILLKGAARLWTRGGEAFLHDSKDIDLLVAPYQILTATSALRAHGYREFMTAKHAAHYEHAHHHAAPLYPPGHGVAVELHRALQLRGLVNLPIAYTDVTRFVMRVETADGSALMFDRVGTALHLLAHGYSRPELRDIALLASLLRDMTAHERSIVEAMVQSERLERVRIGAMAYAAARCAMIPWTADERIERFFQWMLIREDLPRPLRARPQSVDAWLACDERPWPAALRAAFDVPLAERALRTEGSTMRHAMRPFARIGAACAIVLYLRRLSARS